MELETRTPDEMLDGAMKRIISIAEAVIKAFPRLELKVGQMYRYSFDVNSTYIFVGYSDNGFFLHLTRWRDGAKMKATKYSESPEEIKIEL